MKKRYFAFLLLMLTFSIFATPNSQSAKLLGHKEMEFSFGMKEYTAINVNLGTPMNTARFHSTWAFTTPVLVSAYISSAFNLRAGINEWVEYQFQGGISNRYYFCLLAYYTPLFVPDFKVYAETGVKIKLFEGSRLCGALVTTAGINFAIEPLFNLYQITPTSAPYSTNITFEITPLFDITPKKPDSRVTCYFGFPTSLEYSLFEINYSGDFGLGDVRRSFPNATVGFLFGIEAAKRKIIVRHEFFFQYTIRTYSEFNGNIAENIFADDWEIIGTEHLFSTGYCISLGGRTYRK